jgi:hypothetical protein
VFTTGDVDANGVGTVTLRFDSCADSLTGVTITGEVQFRILARNEPGGIVTRGEYTLRGLDVRGAGNVLVDGRIGITADVPAQQRTFTLDVSWREEGVRPAIDYRGLVLTYVAPPVGDARAPTIALSGRIYMADLGYVAVRSERPFILSRTSTEFPLAGGPLLIDGAGPSRLEVTANVDQAADLRLDADGNGAFEHRARVAWLLLLQPLGGNIADRDGDGLHDSWETAYGLDPGNAADAAGDADGDGFTNAEEYVKVTAANDAIRFPRLRTDAVIDFRVAPARTAVGTDITYEARLRNLGPSPNATSVQVRGLLQNATLLSVDPMEGVNCLLAGEQLRCQLGGIAIGRELILRINARAGAAPTTARLSLALYVEQFDAAQANDLAVATTAIE